MEIAGSHSLCLDYKSPCQRMHGHNWIIVVEIESDTLNDQGMIIDFSVIKEVVYQLDHQNINEIIKCNPTAENIAEWIAHQIQDKINKSLPDPNKVKSTRIIPAIAEILLNHLKNGKRTVSIRSMHKILSKHFPESVKPHPRGLWATIAKNIQEKESSKKKNPVYKAGLKISTFGYGQEIMCKISKIGIEESFKIHMPTVVEVSVQESEGNTACYIP